ncbi:MAG: hypothetical protein RLZZ69_2592, partial [Cyanobacteriota bacterium]
DVAHQEPETSGDSTTIIVPIDEIFEVETKNVSDEKISDVNVTNEIIIDTNSIPQVSEEHGGSGGNYEYISIDEFAPPEITGDETNLEADSGEEVAYVLYKGSFKNGR